MSRPVDTAGRSAWIDIIWFAKIEDVITRGVVVLYIYKECFNVIQRNDTYSKSDLEQGWIELILASQRLLLGTLYRPPTDNQFFESSILPWMICGGKDLTS